MDPYLETLAQTLRSATEGLSSEQLSWHPPGKWSAAEVLEHLYLTYTGTAKGFERVIASGKSLATASNWKHQAGILLVIRLGYLPGGRQAPAVARPKGVAADKVMAEIMPALATMDAIIAECERKFGRTHKLLDHPILGPLNSREWKKFHLVHGIHHAKQIRRLRDAAPKTLHVTA